jgi:hypothetical protein
VTGSTEPGSTEPGPTRRGSGRAGVSWLPPLTALALLGAAVLASLFSDPVIEKRPPTTLKIPESVLNPLHLASAAPERTRVVSPPPPAATLPVWVTWLVSGVCLTAVVVLAWLLLRGRWVARRTHARADGPRPEALAAARRRQVGVALDEGLADLDDASADPREVVIACWVRLERVAAATGTTRAPGDTSTDLVARLLAEHQVSGDMLAAFAAIYRQARFAASPVGAGTREQARAALRQLRDELAAGAR